MILFSPNLNHVFVRPIDKFIMFRDLTPFMIHPADDVQHMGCSILNISSYPFENALGKMKILIRHGNKPLAQICRRIGINIIIY